MPIPPRTVGATVFHQAWRDLRVRFVLVVALSVRAAVAVAALQQGTTESPDTHTYVRPAASLVAVGRFDSEAAPELARTPGYPLLLVVGELTQRLVPTTLALQVLLSTATTLGVAVLVLAMGGTQRMAVVAAAIHALEPTGIIYVSKILTETLFTAVVTATLITLTLWVQRGERKLLVLTSALTAAAGFVRPIAYYAPLPLAALVMFIAWRPRHARAREVLLSVATVVVFAGAPLAAWRVRNAAVAGYDGFAAIADVNLLYYRAAGVVARRSGKPIDEVQTQMRREFDVDAPLLATDRLARGHERTARYLEMRRRGTAIIVNDPKAVALDWVAGAGRTVFGRETTAWTALLGFETLSRPWTVVRLFLTAIWFPVLLLALIGLTRVQWNLPLVLPGLLVSTYLVVLGSGPEAYSRFRVPWASVIFVFAAAGAIHVRQYMVTWFDRRFRRQT